eukprot:354763-Chlamydomonas_euryale.AAC.1
MLMHVWYLQHARIRPEKRLAMARDIAEGMAYLHGRTPAIIHGDVKSLNLLVDYDLGIKEGGTCHHPALYVVHAFAQGVKPRQHGRRQRCIGWSAAPKRLTSTRTASCCGSWLPGCAHGWAITSARYVVKVVACMDEVDWLQGVASLRHACGGLRYRFLHGCGPADGSAGAGSESGEHAGWQSEAAFVPLCLSA